MKVILSNFIETEEKSNIKVTARDELNVSSGTVEFKTLSKYAYVFGDTKDIASRVVWKIPSEDEVFTASKDLGYFESATINKNFKKVCYYIDVEVQNALKIPQSPNGDSSL